MKTIKLYDYQIEFIRGLLKSKQPDRDTRLMAEDILDAINKQAPEEVYELSLLTGELIRITTEEVD